jgi:hypothetical protein
MLSRVVFGARLDAHVDDDKQRFLGAARSALMQLKGTA